MNKTHRLAHDFQSLITNELDRFFFFVEKAAPSKTEIPRIFFKYCLVLCKPQHHEWDEFETAMDMVEAADSPLPLELVRPDYCVVPLQY